MADPCNQTTAALSPDELDRLIRHLRKQDQSFIENIGGWRRTVKTNHCIAADYLEALRSELPNWQVSQYTADLPQEPDDIMPMILSAFDQIVSDRRCEHRGVCYLGRECQCFTDAESRVRRSEANAR